ALLVLVEGRGELLLHRLAQLLAEGTALAGEDDGRIPGGLNGLQAALEELLARRGIGELAALGGLPGARLRAVGAQQRLDRWMIRAEVRAEVREPHRDRDLVDLGVARHRGCEARLERGQTG